AQDVRLGCRRPRGARPRRRSGADFKCLDRFQAGRAGGGGDGKSRLPAVQLRGRSLRVLVLRGGGVSSAPALGHRLRDVRVLLIVVGLLAAAVQVPGIVYTTRVRDAEAAGAQGRQEKAVELAGEAIDAAPWAATPYTQRAIAEDLLGRLVAARSDAESAIA